MCIEYYLLSVIALSAVDCAKRRMHSLTQGSENQKIQILQMLKHVEKALSRYDTDIQLLLCSRLGSAFSSLKPAEGQSISFLSSTGLWRERLVRREGGW